MNIVNKWYCSPDNCVADLNMRFGRLDINRDTSRVSVATLCIVPSWDYRCWMLAHWTILESSQFSIPLFSQCATIFRNVFHLYSATRGKCGYGTSNYGRLAAFSSQKRRKRIHFALSIPVLTTAQWLNAHDFWKHLKCLVAHNVNIIVAIRFV